MSEARVRVSLTEGVLEFEGPENFVSGLVDKFTTVIQTALAGESTAIDCGEDGKDASVADAKPIAAAVEPPAPAAAPAAVTFNDIFAATNEGVQILRALPGASKAARAVNLAKLYLYGLQVLKQRDTALFEEIGRACKLHGCFDAHNMAAYLKGNRASFVFGGKGKRQTIKLSTPGIEGTTALIARMRAGGNGITRRPQGITRRGIADRADVRESTPAHKGTLAT